MSVSGCLFDYDKLMDVSKNTIARMSARQVYDRLLSWTKKYDTEFYILLNDNEQYAIDILSIGRGGKKPRKDFGTWSEVRNNISFFYDTLFTPDYEYLKNADKQTVLSVLSEYPTLYDERDDQNEWFTKLKSLASKLSYAPEMKEYKENPGNFKGSVADIAMILRVAVTGRQQSPDTFEVIRIMGREKLTKRIALAQKSLF